ncbi:putative chromosome-partitioning protein ParB [Campylobacterota bacterium]|nr:putative chromosome-partitioning protein ParB [Campylobacterota bacterium]
MAKRATLGRGIGAILDEVEEAYAADVRGNADSVMLLDTSEIEPNPFQPRKVFDQTALGELAESIKRHGLLQPIVVFERGGKYVLIAGERRLRACRLAGITSVRAIVADINYGKLRELALIENIQRQDLNAMELAGSFNELISEYDLTHEALSDLVGKSRTYVTNILRLLQLGSYAQEAIGSDKISYGHGKILVGLNEAEERKIVDSIANQKLSVRETETLLQSIRRDKLDAEANAASGGVGGVGGVGVYMQRSARFDMSSVIEALKAQKFEAKSKKNTIVISFTSQAECDNFAKVIKG